MQDTATNRKIVQEGLDRRAALRQEREQRLDLQTEEMLRAICQRADQLNSAAQETQDQAAVRRASRRKEAAINRKAQAAEAAICFSWYSFLLRVFTPMLIGAATLGLANRGMIPYIVAVPGSILACLFSVEALVSRIITHHHQQKPATTATKTRKGEM